MNDGEDSVSSKDGGVHVGGEGKVEAHDIVGRDYIKIVPNLKLELNVCEICGRTNEPTQTFRCNECRRMGLCQSHQDKQSLLCSECSRERRKQKNVRTVILTTISGILMLTVLLALVWRFSILSNTNLQPTTTVTTDSLLAIATLPPGVPPTATRIKEGPCPYQRRTQDQPLEIMVQIPEGYVAYLQATVFDDEDGGFFVTFHAPYEGNHIFRYGVYCLPVPANSVQARQTEDYMKKLCQQSLDAGHKGCPTKLDKR